MLGVRNERGRSPLPAVTEKHQAPHRVDGARGTVHGKSFDGSREHVRCHKTTLGCMEDRDGGDHNQNTFEHRRDIFRLGVSERMVFVWRRRASE